MKTITIQSQTKQQLLDENEANQAKRKHYPFTHAPKELLRTKYLSPYLPETTTEDFYINSMLDWTNPALADYKRLERWRPDRNNRNNTSSSFDASSNPTSPYSTYSPNTTPDEEIVYLYNQENKLIHTILDSGIEIEFAYDGVGRMLKKTTIDDTGTDTITTTWKYHHANGKITTIDIDATSTDGSTPPVVTDIRDETLHIYFGPTQLPIGFKWDQYDYTEGETTSETYYYLYDVHGNVVKVIDDTATVKITYEYDALGKIVTETNPDSIPNPFKWGGAKQTLHNNLINTFSNRAGNYRPDTGTLLGGGAPVFTNPTSGNVLNKMGRSNVSAGQMRSDRQRAINGGGSGGGYVPNFDPVTVSLVIEAIGVLISIVSFVIDLFPSAKSDYTTAEEIAKAFQKGTFTSETRTTRINSVTTITSHGVKIHSKGFRSLLKRYGSGISVGSDGWVYGFEWDEGSVEVYETPGLTEGPKAMISVGLYAGQVSYTSLELAKAWTGVGLSEGNGPVKFKDFNGNAGHLADIIFNATAAFDSANGGAGAHSGSNCLREKFYTKLKDAIDADKRFNVDADNLTEFIQSFEDTYGKLTDSDDDGYTRYSK